MTVPPQKNLVLVLASLSTLVQNSVFKLQKGERQGDQITVYLFILALEILFYLIKTNKKIEGLNIGDYSFLHSAYADDTTFILKMFHLS